MSEKKPISHVWVLEATIPYETSYIVGLFESKRDADARLNKINRENEKYTRELAAWDKKTDGLKPDDEWPDSPKCPEHTDCVFNIFKMRIIPKKP